MIDGLMRMQIDKKEMLEVMLKQLKSYDKWPNENADKFRFVEQLRGAAGLHDASDKMAYLEEREKLRLSYFDDENKEVKRSVKIDILHCKF